MSLEKRKSTIFSFFSHPFVLTVLKSIRAFYHSQEVRDLLDTMQSQVLSMQSDDKLKELDIIDLKEKIFENTASLVVEMGEEAGSSRELPCLTGFAAMVLKCANPPLTPRKLTRYSSF